MLHKTNNKNYDCNYNYNYNHNNYYYDNNYDYDNNCKNSKIVLERFYQDEIIKLQNKVKELKIAMQNDINQTQIQLTQIIASIQKREEELTCCVCMIEKKTHANMNCCHMCVCEKCSYSLHNKCPLCRSIGVFKKIIV
jgi:hypothetical protein